MKEKISLERLIDLHVEYRAGVPSNRELMWYELGTWQMEALRSLGMQPVHSLLDIGCGPMRLGMQAVPYLEDGNFFGVDPYPPYKELGAAIMNEIGCSKPYCAEVSDKLPFQGFERKMNFAIAQSVITHLSLEQIDLLFRNLKEVMEKEGSFLFTFNHNRYPLGFLYEAKHPMMAPAFIDREFFQKVADEYRIEVVFDPLPDFPHPTGQAVAYFKY
jgi:cyclopropane fatty-acyl-phospholipid synthase-like methyltransferase